MICSLSLDSSFIYDAYIRNEIRRFRNLMSIGHLCVCVYIISKQKCWATNSYAVVKCHNKTAILFRVQYAVFQVWNCEIT